MASRTTESPNQTEPIEKGLTDLTLEGKSGAESNGVHDNAYETEKDSATAPNETSDANSGDIFTSSPGPLEQLVQDSTSREKLIAEKEAEKSPDSGAYVVETVNKIDVKEPEGERKVYVPTGIVHENADSIDQPEAASKYSGDVGVTEKEAQKHPEVDIAEKASPQTPEVAIAEKEAKANPERSYVVKTVDHRAIQDPKSEVEVEVPTGVVHEDADGVEKPQQGKGIVQSITQSVKNVLSSFTGSKPRNDNEEKNDQTA
ncbi:hypothetical protein KP509_12G070000 [Ceratopteris richardii]|uniref:Uncharacterized protein n=1 Tax=Ceratopteris richardii TaxID=49495 RepID=A0A8T2TMJ9_CERRI|nr:hypothetical protein KP509_12G070000 [Ceratopteris richardii]